MGFVLPREAVPVCPLPATATARLWDAACAGHIPVPQSLPGTCWDTLVIAPCAWGLWHSWRAEGSVSLCSS